MHVPVRGAMHAEASMPRSARVQAAGLLASCGKLCGKACDQAGIKPCITVYKLAISRVKPVDKPVGNYVYSLWIAMDNVCRHTAIRVSNLLRNVEKYAFTLRTLAWLVNRRWASA
jgi:hypothetical protein